MYGTPLCVVLISSPDEFNYDVHRRSKFLQNIYEISQNWKIQKFKNLTQLPHIFVWLSRISTVYMVSCHLQQKQLLNSMYIAVFMICIGNRGGVYRLSQQFTCVLLEWLPSSEEYGRGRGGENTLEFIVHLKMRKVYMWPAVIVRVSDAWGVMAWAVRSCWTKVSAVQW